MTMGFSVNYPCSALLLVNLLLAFSIDTAAAVFSDEEVALLKRQVETLITYREQDYNSLAAALKASVAKSEAVLGLTSEIQGLRKEIDRLKRSNGSRTSNEKRNDSKKLKWFMATVQELRKEMRDISFSKTLLDRQSCRNDLEAVRKDVQALRRDMETTRAQVSKVSQDVRTLAQDEEERENSVEPILPDPRFRSGKLFLKTKRRLEKDQHALHHRLTTLAARHEAMLGRLAALEAGARTAAAQLANVSQTAAGVGHLHSSVLELLESIQTVESKVDQNVPLIQREISKLEFGVAQINATLQVVNETRESDANYLSKLTAGLATLSEKVEANNILTQALRASQTEMPPLRTGLGLDEDGKLSAEEIMRQMESIHEAYMEVVEKLPSGCEGHVGLTLISVGKPVLCDAHGWMTVQRRVDGAQPFNLKWVEYARGFGNAASEFWLGNTALHAMTSRANMSLRIEFVDIYGKAWFAEYDSFRVGSEAEDYRLDLSGYHGNASDALSFQNGMRFSTIDRDNDLSHSNCARNYEGGWWFSHCLHANLNGKFDLGLTWFHVEKNEWIAVASSSMKIRRRQDS